MVEVVDLSSELSVIASGQMSISSLNVVKTVLEDMQHRLSNLTGTKASLKKHSKLITSICIAQMKGFPHLNPISSDKCVKSFIELCFRSHSILSSFLYIDSPSFTDAVITSLLVHFTAFCSKHCSTFDEFSSMTTSAIALFTHGTVNMPHIEALGIRKSEIECVFEKLLSDGRISNPGAIFSTIISIIWIALTKFFSASSLTYSSSIFPLVQRLLLRLLARLSLCRLLIVSQPTRLNLDKLNLYCTQLCRRSSPVIDAGHDVYAVAMSLTMLCLSHVNSDSNLSLSLANATSFIVRGIVDHTVAYFRHVSFNVEFVENCNAIACSIQFNHRNDEETQPIAMLFQNMCGLFTGEVSGDANVWMMDSMSWLRCLNMSDNSSTSIQSNLIHIHYILVYALLQFNNSTLWVQYAPVGLLITDAVRNHDVRVDNDSFMLLYEIFRSGCSIAKLVCERFQLADFKWFLSSCLMSVTIMSALPSSCAEFSKLRRFMKEDILNSCIHVFKSRSILVQEFLYDDDDMFGLLQDFCIRLCCLIDKISSDDIVSLIETVCSNLSSLPLLVASIYLSTSKVLKPTIGDDFRSRAKDCVVSYWIGDDARSVSDRIRQSCLVSSPGFPVKFDANNKKSISMELSISEYLDVIDVVFLSQVCRTCYQSDSKRFCRENDFLFSESRSIKSPISVITSSLPIEACMAPSLHDVAQQLREFNDDDESTVKTIFFTIITSINFLARHECRNTKGDIDVMEYSWTDDEMKTYQHCCALNRQVYCAIKRVISPHNITHLSSSGNIWLLVSCVSKIAFTSRNFGDFGVLEGLFEDVGNIMPSFTCNELCLQSLVNEWNTIGWTIITMFMSCKQISAASQFVERWSINSVQLLADEGKVGLFHESALASWIFRILDKDCCDDDEGSKLLDVCRAAEKCPNLSSVCLLGIAGQGITDKDVVKFSPSVALRNYAISSITSFLACTPATSLALCRRTLDGVRTKIEEVKASLVQVSNSINPVICQDYQLCLSGNLILEFWSTPFVSLCSQTAIIYNLVGDNSHSNQFAKLSKTCGVGSCFLNVSTLISVESVAVHDILHGKSEKVVESFKPLLNQLKVANATFGCSMTYWFDSLMMVLDLAKRIMGTQTDEPLMQQFPYYWMNDVVKLLSCVVPYSVQTSANRKTCHASIFAGINTPLRREENLNRASSCAVTQQKYRKSSLLTGFSGLGNLNDISKHAARQAMMMFSSMYCGSRNLQSMIESKEPDLLGEYGDVNIAVQALERLQSLLVDEDRNRTIIGISCIDLKSIGIARIEPSGVPLCVVLQFDDGDDILRDWFSEWQSVVDMTNASCLSGSALSSSGEQSRETVSGWWKLRAKADERISAMLRQLPAMYGPWLGLLFGKLPADQDRELRGYVLKDVEALLEDESIRSDAVTMLDWCVNNKNSEFSDNFIDWICVYVRTCSDWSDGRQEMLLGILKGYYDVNCTVIRQHVSADIPMYISEILGRVIHDRSERHYLDMCVQMKQISDAEAMKFDEKIGNMTDKRGSPTIAHPTTEIQAMKKSKRRVQFSSQSAVPALGTLKKSKTPLPLTAAIFEDAETVEETPNRLIGMIGASASGNRRNYSQHPVKTVSNTARRLFTDADDDFKYEVAFDVDENDQDVGIEVGRGRVEDIEAGKLRVSNILTSQTPKTSTRKPRKIDNVESSSKAGSESLQNMKVAELKQMLKDVGGDLTNIAKLKKADIISRIELTESCRKTVIPCSAIDDAQIDIPTPAISRALWKNDETIDNTLRELGNLAVDANKSTAKKSKSKHGWESLVAGYEASHAIIVNQFKGPVCLIVDESMYSIPFECLSFMMDSTVSRVPNEKILIQLLTHKKLKRNENAGWWIVDPYSELPDRGNAVNDMLKFLTSSSESSWKEFHNVAPSEDQIRENHGNSDSFIFSGHGAGERMFTDSVMSSLTRAPNCFLWGCSSAKLKKSGIHDPSGLPLKYLSLGSSVVIGNLWDVTDVDLNRMSSRFLYHMLTDMGKDQQIPLSAILASVRGICKLVSANGCACVIWGLS